MDNLKMAQLDFGFECEPVSVQKKTPKPHKKRDNDFVFHFMDCLSSPIIVFKSAWQYMIPKDILKNIKLSRLLCSMQQEETASLTETLAYMMPRTYEAPLPPEWANIYTWLGLQYAKQFKKEAQHEAMKDIAPEELTDYEKGLLENLRSWIYKQRRKALKERLRNTGTSKIDKPIIIQETLFDG